MLFLQKALQAHTLSKRLVLTSTEEVVLQANSNIRLCLVLPRWQGCPVLVEIARTRYLGYALQYFMERLEIVIFAHNHPSWMSRVSRFNLDEVVILWLITETAFVLWIRGGID